jgi:hypothetical protein
VENRSRLRPETIRLFLAGAVVVVIAIAQYVFMSTFCNVNLKENGNCAEAAFYSALAGTFVALPCMLWVSFVAMRHDRSIATRVAVWISIAAALFIGNYFFATPLVGLVQMPSSSEVLVLNALYDATVAVLVVVYGLIVRDLLPVRETLYAWLVIFFAPFLASALFDVLHR